MIKSIIVAILGLGMLLFVGLAAAAPITLTDITKFTAGGTVESNDLKALIKQNAEEKWGIACRFVYWPSLSTEHLDLLLQRMPAEHLRKIVRHILDDRKENRAGMPDLIQFPSSGGYELVEVKGPGDRLQSNQKAWMQFYHEHDIPHRVIRVLR